MTKILNAATIIESKIDTLRQKVLELEKNGLCPSLSVILVGDNPASLSYIKNKRRFCERIGAKFDLIQLKEDVTQEQFLNEVDKINNAPNVTGCFVQLPVPKHLQSIDITQLISPKKDVDGFHLDSINQIYTGNLSGLISCTPKGIVTLLKENQIQIEGSDIVILGRSHIVGKPLSLLLQTLNATVTLCHSRTKDIKKHTQKADIIIAAIGNAHFVDRSYLSGKKNQVIVDVGMNKKDGKLVGDVNYQDVFDEVKAITPVPGGVGPMTVFSLMENLIQATSNILNKG